jgi:hypothetical protein
MMWLREAILVPIFSSFEGFRSLQEHGVGGAGEWEGGSRGSGGYGVIDNIDES